MSTLGVILSWALCGLVVGLIARFLVPGPQPLGILRTILLGVVGAFAGGVLHWAIYRSPGEPFSFSANAWPGWIFLNHRGRDRSRALQLVATTPE